MGDAEGVIPETPPTLRAVRAGDEQFLRNLFATAWERALALADWPAEKREAVLQQQFEAQQESDRAAHPEANHDLIVVDGEPIGRLYARREAELIGLMDISLLPAWQNRGHREPRKR